MTTETFPPTKYAIGRTRTGDQLHCCTVYVKEDGKMYGGCNAHCNNRSHLAVSSHGKREIKIRPGLLCKTCFGTDEAKILAREFHNATLVARSTP